MVDVALYESVFRLLDYLALAYDTAGRGAGAQRGRRPPRHAPQPLPHRGREVGGHRLHQRPHLPAPGGGYGRLRRRTAGAPTPPRPWRAASPTGTRWTPASSPGPARYTMADLCARLDRAEVPNSPIYSIADAFADPQYAYAETLSVVDDPVLGALRVPAPRPPPLPHPGRAPHARAQPRGAQRCRLRRLLGLLAADLEALQAEGVI